MKHPATVLTLLIGLALCVDLAAQPRHREDERPVRARLRQHGMPDDEAERIVTIFGQAVEENMDTALLHTRLHEGLAKRIPPDVLAQALQTRLDALRAAHRLLLIDAPVANDEDTPTSERAIVDTLAQALESGVPEMALSGLRMRNRDEAGLRQRLQAFIEAAEVLHLAGVDAQDIQRFIDAGIEQEAGRGVIVRATADWLELHRQGIDGETISSRIWMGGRQRHGSGRRQRQRRRTTH